MRRHIAYQSAALLTRSSSDPYWRKPSDDKLPARSAPNGDPSSQMPKRPTPMVHHLEGQTLRAKQPRLGEASQGPWEN